MNKAFGLSLGAVVLGFLILARGAIGQEPFPDEPGRDTMLLACSQCHSAGKMLSVELTSDEWEFTVYDMLARGANVHADEVDAVVEYLQDNFSTDGKAEE